ncbi:GGDEF domain-containing phosphodiesterase [uncultured Paraglaciecola sp.]|uniref:GGDEF domain-containing phosphodiesterase n=1 Tax=uncultured Paraglaciecola sp. TaxID=1765024 RepID=UPI0025FD9A52|nr:GGDEF domain-containing phosphodiesterase [uncultured Paraglaciecola sp.]
MIENLKRSFLNYLMLSDNDDTFGGLERWRVSALRIMIISGYSLYSVVAIHCLIKSFENGYYATLPVILGFYIVGGLQLWLSKTHYYLSSYSLLISIVLAAVCINSMVQIPTLAMLGPVFIFSLPLVAFVLLGLKVGVICIILNILPFVTLLNGFQLNQYISEHAYVEGANAYIFSIIFLFFNVCIPLAVARANVANFRLNKRITAQNVNLQLQNDFYKTLFVETDIAKLVVCSNGFISEMNTAAEQLLDCNFKQRTQVIPISELFFDMPSEEGTITVNLTVAGKMKAFKVSRSALLNNSYYFLTVQDVTAKVILHKTLAAQTLLYRKQNLDEATRLPNRTWLESHLKNQLSYSDTKLCIVAIRIKNAEFVAQKHGFQTMPLMIRKLADQWLSETKVECQFASVEPNNLTIVCELSDKGAQSLLTSFIEQLPKNLKIKGQKIPLDIQFGISLSDGANLQSEKLVNNALYAANSSNLEINFYQTSSLERFIEQQEINLLLSEAIANDELHIVYQPKVEGDGRLIGLEALLRWNSPVIGAVSPSVFIPIAEKSGLVTSLTRWLILNVCKQINDWQQSNLQLVPVAINISGADLDQDDFHEHLIKPLIEYKIKPQLIELELTESARSISNEKALSTINHLVNWGFDITIDDFGIGYSGISKLISYPVKKVKIDRQFIKNIDKDKRKSQVIEAIIAMCKVFNIQILAEGTENFAEVDTLIKLGCHNFQGYVFSKPMKAENVRQLLLVQNVLDFNKCSPLGIR